MTHENASEKTPRTAGEWDERYGTAEIWSGEPNATLTTVVSDLEPGTALEIGCGEGADAVWLAGRGRDVTALDVSRVAVERARARDRVVLARRTRGRRTGAPPGQHAHGTVPHSASPDPPRTESRIERVLSTGGSHRPGGGGASGAGVLRAPPERHRDRVLDSREKGRARL